MSGYEIGNFADLWRKTILRKIIAKSLYDVRIEAFLNRAQKAYHKRKN